MKGEILDPKELMRDSAFDPADLDNSMMKQAGLFSHYAVKAAQSQEKSDNMKMLRDVTESKIDKEVRDTAADEGRKITEKMIDGEVRRDVRWVKAQKSYNGAKAEAELCKHALEALKQKRDMMIQIGVGMREEMKGDLRVKVAEAGAEKSQSLRDNARRIALKG